jgi:ring-1,2-phenylacetyl-CoA epoxidase subunit PaaE
MSDFHTLPVSHIKKESTNSVSITFDVPSDLKDLYQFKAGQYITLKHTISGKEYRRAYSICSSINSDQLKVAVKKVENGVFSVFATTSLKAGDVLDVMTPQGKFVLDANPVNSKNYLAFAAGSGITPILSMVRTMLEIEPKSTFVLVFGNQTQSEAMFHSELKELQQKFTDQLYIEQLYIEFIYSREQVNDARFGRIDKSIVNYILKNKFEGRKFDEFYLCGPKSMIDEVQFALSENGYPKKQIHFELFTLPEEASEAIKKDGYTQVTVLLDDETTTFQMSQSKTVLEAALEQKIDAPFSCQGGICSTCIARIVDGTAEMRKNQILTDSDIEDGLILTCQAQPTSPSLTIDYDDV